MLGLVFTREVRTIKVMHWKEKDQTHQLLRWDEIRRR